MKTPFIISLAIIIGSIVIAINIQPKSTAKSGLTILNTLMSDGFIRLGNYNKKYYQAETFELKTAYRDSVYMSSYAITRIKEMIDKVNFK